MYRLFRLYVQLLGVIFSVFTIIHYCGIFLYASVHCVHNVGGDVLTHRLHLRSWILTSEKWDCWVQKVKCSGEFDLGCAG
jgi:hypothetical protein